MLALTGWGGDGIERGCTYNICWGNRKTGAQGGAIPLAPGSTRVLSEITWGKRRSETRRSGNVIPP